MPQGIMRKMPVGQYTTWMLTIQLLLGEQGRLEAANIWLTENMYKL